MLQLDILQNYKIKVAMDACVCSKIKHTSSKSSSIWYRNLHPLDYIQKWQAVVWGGGGGEGDTFENIWAVLDRISEGGYETRQ